jgi:PRTRC genetic system protein A
MNSDKLITPIYLKTSDDMPLPAGESAYLLLTGNGIWMCRNHEFFQSCAPARSWPCELARHRSSLSLNYPKIPRELLEQIVGFFGVIAENHEAEAGALLIWDKSRQRMDIHVPQQLATVERTWSGKIYPIGLHYDRPTDLGPERIIVADLHSHVFHTAYTSAVDEVDARYRAGLHIVVGCLDLEPPQFHCEFVVDGEHFPLKSPQVIEGYESRRDDFPDEWLDRVSIKTYGASQNTTANDNAWTSPQSQHKSRHDGEEETFGNEC